MPQEPEKRSIVNGRWQAAFFGTLLIMVVLLEVLFLPSSTQDLPYSKFKKLVQTGQVADLKIGATTIHGTLLDKTAAPSPETTTPEQPERFTTTRVEDPGLVAELEAHGIAFSGQADNSWLLNLFS
jgi:cell division protease FtsH